jgi:hypothetical protein
MVAWAPQIHFGVSPALATWAYFIIQFKICPNATSSCFANVHLLALCYSLDLKVHGYCPVLERFVAEMKKLQSEGFVGDFPIIGRQQIFVGLCQVACDNLALNGLFGFIECFSADYFCTICLAPQEAIQVKTYELEFCMRTACEYDNDVKRLSTMTSRNHSQGVESACVLNDIPGFHVTDSFVLDPIHTLLEGIVPYELSCILYEVISVKRYFNLVHLNACINEFFDKNSVDKSNRPPCLNRIERPGGGLSPSMNAVQMWALLRYLPLIVGSFVPQEDAS